jgi:trans-aconitate methyltransferase
MKGVDSSVKSIEFAKQKYGSEHVEFKQISKFQASEQIDLAFCNGVFHHIPVEARLSAIALINRSLRHGAFSRCGRTTHGIHAPVTS